MKKNYKKLIFPALAVAIFLPLVSMAASDSISLSGKAGKAVQHRESFTEKFDHSFVNKEDRVMQRESRTLENRAKHTEMMNVLEKGDYNAWLEFVEDRDYSMTSRINEENFSEFIEAHREKVSNRGSEARELNRFKKGIR
jgi:PAB1-binding protein PBP1